MKFQIPIKVLLIAAILLANSAALRLYSCSALYFNGTTIVVDDLNWCRATSKSVCQMYKEHIVELRCSFGIVLYSEYRLESVKQNEVKYSKVSHVSFNRIKIKRGSTVTRNCPNIANIMIERISEV